MRNAGNVQVPSDDIDNRSPQVSTYICISYLRVFNHFDIRSKGSGTLNSLLSSLYLHESIRVLQYIAQRDSALQPSSTARVNDTPHGKSKPGLHKTYRKVCNILRVRKRDMNENRTVTGQVRLYRKQLVGSQMAYA